MLGEAKALMHKMLRALKEKRDELREQPRNGDLLQIDSLELVSISGNYSYEEVDEDEDHSGLIPPLLQADGDEDHSDLLASPLRISFEKEVAKSVPMVD